MRERALEASTSRGEAVGCLRRAFAAAGIEEAALEARALVAAAAGIDATGLAIRPELPLGPEAAGRLAGYAARRLTREPVGRILGRRDFWGATFRLSPATLEPRPETEALVEAALRAFPDPQAPLSVLDLGTGTGCILVALLSERPRATGFGIDRAPEALAVARANAAMAGVGRRASFAASNWAHAVEGRFDLVVANPPYIPHGDIEGLAPEVSRHDPIAALDGGPDGLDAYRAILPDLPRLLATGGHAYLEIGHDQGAALIRLAGEKGLQTPALLPDLAGRDRVFVLAPVV